MGQQQRQLLRRGQQDVGRGYGAGAGGARPGVSPVRVSTVPAAHLGDGRFQVARHVHRQRLERRDVKRVQAALAARARFGRPARSIRLGRKPARVLPPPVGATSSTLSPRCAHSAS